MNTIGNNIRITREQHGLSQEVLADELGITQPSYARLEKQDDRISITRLIAIAKILNTTVAKLINENSGKVINQQNSKNPLAYNVETIIKADKAHIATLKEEIALFKRVA